MLRDNVVAVKLAMGISAATLGLAVTQAFAQDVTNAEQSRFFPLVVPIYDVDVPVGTIKVLANQEGDFRVSRESLLSVLKRLVSDKEFQRLSLELNDYQEIGSADVETLSINLRFDPSKVALFLILPPDVRGSEELALSSPPSAPPPTADRRAPSDFSAYTNVALAYQNDPSFAEGSLATLQLDSAVRIAGLVIENRSALELGGGASRTFSREATRITKDLPNQSLRVVVGDIFTTSRGFVQSLDILGGSIIKNVEVFNPFVNTRPTGRQSFTLERSALTSIFVNGQLVRQVRLAPGNYDLTNFALIDGANDVTIETRDDFGQLHTIDFTSFFNSDLIARGYTTWGINAGVRSNRFDRQLKYEFHEPIATGFYRRGVTDTLTLGLNAQYRPKQSILGFEVVSANRFSNFSLDAALGAGEGTLGGAVALAVQPRISGYLGRQGRRLDIFAELTSSGFGENPFNGLRESARFGARYSDYNVTDRFSLAASASYTAARDARNNGYDATLTVGYRFENGYSLRVTPNYRQSLSGSNQFAVLATLTKSFGPRTRARATYDTRGNRALAEYDYLSQFGGIGTVGANVVASRADDQNGSLSANATYLGNRFEMSAGYSQDVEGPRGFNVGRLNFVMQTAVAYTDGTVAIGRPIRDSFAIVTRHPSLKGKQVIIDPGSAGRGDRARSGSLGPALINDLSSYNISKPSYNVLDAPPGFNLGSGVLEFFPPYFSGHIAEVGSSRSASGLGNLVDRTGKAIAFISGTLTSIDDSGFQDQPIFTNRAGKFALIGLQPGKSYLAEFPDAGAKFVVKVPDDAEGFFQMGVVTVK